MKKRLLFRIFSVILALTAIAAVLLKRDIRIRLMPRAAVRNAVLETADALTQRFEANPVLHISKVLQLPEQKVRFVFPELDTEAAIRLDPRVLDGHWQNSRLSARFYADKDSIAISSEQLTKNRWFGIVYDQFAEDISQIPLISWILSDTLLKEWEAGLQRIRTAFLSDWNYPELPSFSRESLSRLTLALASMKTEVSKTTITAGNTPLKCTRIHCRPGGLMSLFFPKLANTPQTACTFYLHSGHLILAQITTEGNGQQITFQLEMQGDTDDSPLRIFYREERGDQAQRICAEIQTRESSGMLEETWKLDIRGRQLAFSYRWDPASGTATVQGGETGPVPVLFVPGDEGIHLETKDFSQLAGIFAPTLTIPDAFSHCIMEMQPGDAPAAPDILTPDHWTAEDLLTLLEGLGSVLHIPFP